tara:strand:+ start:7110 stop:7226 length:117 start_codon:yes stop_codon:yes gene_type:complete
MKNNNKAQGKASSYTWGVKNVGKVANQYHNYGMKKGKK